MNIRQKCLLTVLAFAVVHALCCIFCRGVGLEDTRALTLLTLSLTLILCYLHRLKIPFIIAAAIIVNVLSYLIGSALPMALRPLMGEGTLVNAVSTFSTTLLLGVLFEFAVGFFPADAFSKAAVSAVEYRKRWVVRFNDRIVPVDTGRIAYFVSENKFNYLVTKDGKRYVTDLTMDAIAADLDPSAFFRINRGCILSEGCINSVLVQNGRHAVDLSPALEPNPVVTRSRVDEFLLWMQKA